MSKSYQKSDNTVIGEVLCGTLSSAACEAIAPMKNRAKYDSAMPGKSYRRSSRTAPNHTVSFLKSIQELLERGAVLSWGDEGRVIEKLGGTAKKVYIMSMRCLTQSPRGTARVRANEKI